jgi:hypothetical protein
MPKKSTTPTCPAGTCVKHWISARIPNTPMARRLPAPIDLKAGSFCFTFFAALRHTKKATMVMSTAKIKIMMNSCFILRYVFIQTSRLVFLG